jgi:adenine-specific DNA-methyltransferase
MLLADDGVIYIQIDDEEMCYLKVLLDEIFCRDNFQSCVTVKTKSNAGASGGGEDKRLKKNTESILQYSKNHLVYNPKKLYVEEHLDYILIEKAAKNKDYEYDSILIDYGSREFFSEITLGSGEVVKVFRHVNYEIKKIKEVEKDRLKHYTVYKDYFSDIFRTQDAQSSIRHKVIEAVNSDPSLYSIDYIPRSGRNRGVLTTNYYYKKELVNFLKNSAKFENDEIIKLKELGTLWLDVKWDGIANEGQVKFKQSKKPERLIERILNLSTEKKDIVLDSFLGSGTTAAVAHKMGRKYIGIEMGEHAYTHCKVRLDAVIGGADQSGISKAVEWKGGGAYKFFELAPSFITKDEFGNSVIDAFYNDTKLIKAMCKLMNFTYKPSQIEYWKHGVGQGKNYLYVTTQLLTSGMVQQIAAYLAGGESLVICPKKFEPGADKLDSRITIKKIPQSVLKACHFGKKEYLLPIKESAMEEAEIEDNEE